MSQADNLHQTCPKVLVSLGSNATSTLRDSANLIRDAIEHLAEQDLRITRISHYYSTPCFPPGAGPDFVNVAIGIETDLLPEDILKFLHIVEAEFGRERPSRWAPRTLDLDLIAYEDMVLPDKAKLKHWMNLPLDDQLRLAPDQLILPHPRMHERAFVLIPLADIAPSWRHPIVDRTVQELVSDLPDVEKMGVKPYATP